VVQRDFTTLVYEVVSAIPPGRAMTYGEVAAMIGSRAARAVGRVLAHSSDDLPWWRVVRAGGYPPIGHEKTALDQYEKEGTPLLQSTSGSGIRVDLRIARWNEEPQ
jgi:alkylated DNA nucleotide flippase Atl1